MSSRSSLADIRSAAEAAQAFDAAFSALALLRHKLVEHPSLRDLVLAEALEALRQMNDGLGDFDEARVRGAVSCLLGLDGSPAGVEDREVFHDSSPSVGGCGCSHQPTEGEARKGRDDEQVAS